MANLLQKASIVLTPTAYDNGKVLCAKPSEAPYGDFDFSRNSAATRVNAQGLVENVQILSSNLVQNGDFSEEGVQEISNGSFSQEGVEEITNGDFSSDTAWAKASGTTISDGKLNITANSTNDRTFQNVGMVQGKIYKLVLEVSNYQSGSLFILFGGSGTPNIPNITSNGTYTFYQECIGANGYFYFGGNLFDGSIDNVSAREVGQDWDLRGWEISENKATCDASGGALTMQQQGVLTSGKTYKITYTILDYVQGVLRFRSSPVSGGYTSGNGEHTFYIVAQNATFGLQGLNGFIGSVTNISVKEVGMDWDLGTGWSIAENKAISDATQGYITQTDVSGAGVTATYKVQWTQNITTGTRLRFFARNYNDGGNATTLSITRDDGTSMSGGNCVGSGTFTAYVSSTNGYSFKLLAETGAEADITNITTIEITDDTNLPRINYEGFSYQDALGSELVTNGGFDTDSDWTKVSNTTISGGKANAVSNPNGFFIIQTSTLDVNKTYKLTFDLTDYTSGTLQFATADGDVSFSNTLGAKELIFKPISSNILFKTGNAPATFSIDNVSVKEYLGQEVVPNSGCGSWLFEPQSSNLLTYSSDYNNSIWTKTGSASVTSNTTISPDGTQNADTLNIFSGNFFFQPVVGVGTFTLSCYVKVPNGTLDFKMQSFNGTDGANSSAIFVATTEWQRFEHTVTVTVNSSFYPIQVSGLVGGDFEIWGAQVEQQSYATSYIPTSGSQVTRNQDVCSNGGSLATINSTEGTLYGEFSSIASDNNSNWINISDGTAANWLFVGRDFNKVRIYLRANNAVVVSDTTIPLANNNKVALSYKSGDIRAYINGSEVVNLTSAFSFTSALNTLNFNAYNGGGTTTQIAWKAVAVWKEALSDQELTELTT